MSKQAVDGDTALGRAYKAVGHKVYTERLDALNFVAHHGFGQSVLGYAVHQHAAWLGLPFEYGDIEALARQVACHGKAGGA